MIVLRGGGSKKRQQKVIDRTLASRAPNDPAFAHLNTQREIRDGLAALRTTTRKEAHADDFPLPSIGRREGP